MSNKCTINSLTETAPSFKRRKRVGRGPGSKRGKTCCRGIKGAGARSGYKRRHGAIGGGVPLHRRVPTRGFSNAPFTKNFDVINLYQIQALFEEGETVSFETLKEKGYLSKKGDGVKVLAKGDLSKKVTFDVAAFSKGAKEKLKQAGISVAND